MTKAIMPFHDDFANRQQLIEYLAGQLVKGRLALVLGAGVSIPFGLPTWNDLIKRLYARCGKLPPNDTPLRQAEYFRLTNYPRDPDGFVNAIHGALYESVRTEFSALRNNKTLAAIGALVMSSGRGSVTEVLTLNFDDLLELYLGYNGFVTESIFRRFHWMQSADVTVYHPHGFIPFAEGQPRSSGNEIVFDQTSYPAIVGKENDTWRQTAMTIMRRRTCLFIGLSGRDDNLDSMMNEVRDQHASGDDNTAYWGVVFSTASDEVAKTLWQARKVYYCHIADYQDDLPDLLFSVCQTAAALRKRF